MFLFPTSVFSCISFYSLPLPFPLNPLIHFKKFSQTTSYIFSTKLELELKKILFRNILRWIGKHQCQKQYILSPLHYTKVR